MTKAHTLLFLEMIQKNNVAQFKHTYHKYKMTMFNLWRQQQHMCACTRAHTHTCARARAHTHTQRTGKVDSNI